MDCSDILNLFAFYRQAPAALQQRMQASAQVVELPAGAFYFHEGDTCSQIALLGAGNIRVFKNSETGREITLYHVCTGETCILTASCVLAGASYPATARVEVPAQAVLFPAAHFRAWVGMHEEVRRFIFEILARRVANIMALVEEIAFRKMDQRLAEFLLMRFANAGAPVTSLQLTHEQIAAELGSAREVISRLLKEFERLGAIELGRARIRLRDEQALKSLLFS